MSDADFGLSEAILSPSPHEPGDGDGSGRPSTSWGVDTGRKGRPGRNLPKQHSEGTLSPYFRQRPSGSADKMNDSCPTSQKSRMPPWHEYWVTLMVALISF